MLDVIDNKNYDVISMTL